MENFLKEHWPVLSGQLRHWLNTAGAGLIGAGTVTSDEWQTVVGGVIVVLSMLLSAASKKRSKQ